LSQKNVSVYDQKLYAFSTDGRIGLCGDATRAPVSQGKRKLTETAQGPYLGRSTHASSAKSEKSPQAVRPRNPTNNLLPLIKVDTYILLKRVLIFMML